VTTPTKAITPTKAKKKHHPVVGDNTNKGEI
jgi:hypothetical protein